MVKKNAWKRMLAAALALVTVLSNIVSPMTAYAADSGGESYPKLSEVQEQLSTDEIVTAKDIEVDYSSDFKVSSDFTGISYDAGAVTITLHEAKNSSGASYSSTSPGDYQAVYYVKPTSGNPSYRVSRTITVKKAQKETEATVSAASEDSVEDSDSSGEADDDGDSDDPADADNTEDSGDPADADNAEDSSDPADADNAEDSDDSADANAAEDSGDPAETAETGSDALSTEGGTELTTEEFEAEIEQSEEQETVDEETGMTLATALEEAQEAGIDLAALEVGETVTVSASSLTSSKEEVKITRGSWYYYFENPVPENMPLLEDLYHALLEQEEKEARHVATALEIYVKGSLNLFNHRTNVDIQNRFICYDIKELGKQLKKIGMLVVQDQVWGRVTANRSEGKITRYYMDEFHLLLREEQTAAYSVEIWKRFRKWGGIPTGITQNVKDLLASREVENIFENSDFILMLNQASGDRQILANQLGISPYQLSYVTQSGEGEGLLFYGDVILPFIDRFPQDTELYRIMTTKLSEISGQTLEGQERDAPPTEPEVNHAR